MTSTERKARIENIKGQIAAQAREFNQAYEKNAPTPEYQFLAMKAKVDGLKAEIDTLKNRGDIDQARRIYEETNFGTMRQIVYGDKDSPGYHRTIQKIDATANMIENDPRIADRFKREKTAALEAQKHDVYRQFVGLIKERVPELGYR